MRRDAVIIDITRHANIDEDERARAMALVMKMFGATSANITTYIIRRAPDDITMEHQDGMLRHASCFTAMSRGHCRRRRRFTRRRRLYFYAIVHWFDCWKMFGYHGNDRQLLRQMLLLLSHIAGTPGEKEHIIIIAADG